MENKKENTFKGDIQNSIIKNKIGQSELKNVFNYFLKKFELTMSVNKKQPPCITDRRSQKYRRKECDQFHKDIGKNVKFLSKS